MPNVSASRKQSGCIDWIEPSKSDACEHDVFYFVLSWASQAEAQALADVVHWEIVVAA